MPLPGQRPDKKASAGPRRIPPTGACSSAAGAQKTIFTARHLRIRELQCEINAVLNVVESWNRVGEVIASARVVSWATNRRDEQEMTVACLRILQAALVCVNTLMLQDVLDDPAWAGALDAEADRRGLTPAVLSNVLPYGEVRLA